MSEEVDNSPVVVEDKLAAAELKKKEGNDAFAKKEYTLAITLYGEAIELDPQNHIYYSNRSICHTELGNFSDAAADAEKCIALDPSFVKGYYRLANAQFEQEKYEEAISTIRSGLQKDPTMSELTKLLRKIKLKKGGKSGAQRRPEMDEATRKEVSELSEQYNQTGRDLQEVEMKLTASKREQKRHELTGTQINAIEDGTRLYQSIGKMFMLADKPEVMGSLQEQLEAEQKNESELKARQKFLQRRLQSQELNIKDLITNAMS